MYNMLENTLSTLFVQNDLYGEQIRAENGYREGEFATFKRVWMEFGAAPLSPFTFALHLIWYFGWCILPV